MSRVSASLPLASLLLAGVFTSGFTEGGEKDTTLDTREETTGPEHGKLSTADATPVEPGHFELEPSYAATIVRREWDDRRHLARKCRARIHDLSLSLTAGVGKDVDLKAAWGLTDEFRRTPAALARDADEPCHGKGMREVDLGARWRFHQSSRYSLELAYLASASLPVGEHGSRNRLGVCQEFWSLNQSVVATKDWARWTANAELGYALPFGEKREDARGTLSANLAAGRQIVRWLQPEAELNYAREFLRGRRNDSDVLAATVGLVMPVNDSVRVNAGVQQGLWGRNADRATTFMVAVKFAW